MSPILQVAGVTKRYRDGFALVDVSLTLRSGEIVGLLGPNGAGKSTLMRIVMGLTKADSGSVMVTGSPYGQLEMPVRSVSALLDPSWLDGRISARDALLSHARRLSIADTPRRVTQVLHQVGLTTVESRRIGKLSLGMRQRVAIGMALLGSPALLILDEPVNGLDADGVLWLRRLLKDFAAAGGSVLLSSHLMSEMELVAGRVVVMQRGRVIADEPIGDDSSAEVVTVATIAGDSAPLLQALAARGVRVTADASNSIHVRELPPEDVFDAAVATGVRLSELTHVSRSLEERYRSLTENGLGRDSG